MANENGRNGSVVRIPKWLIGPISTGIVIIVGFFGGYTLIGYKVDQAIANSESNASSIEKMREYREEKLVKKKELDGYKNSTNARLDKIDESLQLLISNLIEEGNKE